MRPWTDSRSCRSVKRRRNSILPASFLLNLCDMVGAQHALPIPASDRWLGNDGLWSPVVLQVGTPPQPVNLLPGLSSPEIIVIGLDGCAGPGDGTQVCRTQRGGIFQANQSSSWEHLGQYEMNLSPQFGIDEGAYYGQDTVALVEPLSESNQLIGIVNTTNYWLGVFGLGVASSGVGSSSILSFLASLQNSDQIPSLSFGYTAGAHYRLKQVPASLTLGGYDEDRFEDNTASFTLNPNSQPVVAVKSIYLNGLDSERLLEPNDQDLYLIDSTTPFLWLPETVADRFAESMGLFYNETLGVYQYNNLTAYENLMRSNFSFTFELADSPSQPTELTLNLAGEALTSHNLTFGFPNLGIEYGDQPIPYVPIRRAANATQYTLGRCFLQETYLTVDYERNTFYLYQTVFSANATNNFVDILSPDTPDTAVSTTIVESDNGLSTGAKVGIAMGVIGMFSALITLTALLVIYRRRLKRREAGTSLSSGASSEPDSSSPPSKRHGLSRFLFWRRLSSPDNEKGIQELPAREADPNSQGGFLSHRAGKRPADAAEVDPANEIKELPAPIATMVELPGSPVEVPGRERADSTAKTGLHDMFSTEGDDISSDPAPTYESTILSSTIAASDEGTGTMQSSSGVSMPSPGLTDFFLSSQGPSPESTLESSGSNNNTNISGREHSAPSRGMTVSSMSSSSVRSLTTATLASRQMSTRSERARYVLDDSQTFELKPRDVRPAGLVSAEGSIIGEGSRRSDGDRDLAETAEGSNSDFGEAPRLGASSGFVEPKWKSDGEELGGEIEDRFVESPRWVGRLDGDRDEEEENRGDLQKINTHSSFDQYRAIVGSKEEEEREAASRQGSGDDERDLKEETK